MRKHDVFSDLESYCQKRYLELGRRHLQRPMLKSYVLETAKRPDRGAFRDLAPLGNLSDQGDGLFSVIDESGPVGYLEIFDRFMILYTLLKTSEVEPLILKTVRRSYALDSMWLANPVFKELLGTIGQLFGPQRFMRMAMEGQRYFGKQDSELEPRFEDEVDERLSNRMLWANRLGTIQRRLSDLQKMEEFRTVSMLRIPASNVPGGHEFYYNGKVTNRSVDFLDHRNAVLSLIRWYKKMTDAIEQEIWLRAESTVLHDGTEAVSLAGGLVVYRFDPPLPAETLEDFIDVTFNRGQGPFRLWGNPIPRGRNYYHVHGLDLHLVQRIFLELSPSRFLLLLPEGTCGNTVHRLLTNMQRYLTPDVTVTIGERLYSDLAKEAIPGSEPFGPPPAAQPATVSRT